MPPQAAAAAPILQMRGIVKTFPGVQALAGVDLDVLPGEVHALIGENGAGKSTLIGVLGGIHLPDSGQIILRGQPVSIPSPRRAREIGIAIIHQELNQVGPLSVAENLFLGDEPRRGHWFVDWETLRARAGALMAELGVRVDPRARVDLLSVAERQTVEIARALSLRADILVMDEPTAALTLEEVERLFAIIDDLRKRGVSIIYISHRLEEIFRIADRVTVMRDGHYVGTYPIATIDMDGLIQLMVGRKLTEKFPKEAVAPGPPRLEVRGLSVGGFFRDVSFAVRAGEILGIAGLVGSGKIEVAHAIFGMLPLDGGEVLVEGRPVTIRSPADAIARRIGLVPEDRKTLGLVLGMSIRDNITLPSLHGLSTAGFVRKDQERAMVAQAIARLDVRARDRDQPVGTLSGGNQQKVVLAKWLQAGAKVVLLCEPTRGIDVGAKVEMYRLMVELARAGVAVVMISSELPEVLGMSDRIIVMHEGRITAEFAHGEATQEKIMASASGRPDRGAAQR
ncbi:MAG TPA: sugar ABC transporter ATP-binding protein [bacterium]|nr:sugar ABC transporter ATP-binding protein [bacterium]